MQGPNYSSKFSVRGNPVVNDQFGMTTLRSIFRDGVPYLESSEKLKLMKWSGISKLS